MFKRIYRKYPHPTFIYFTNIWIIGAMLWQYFKTNEIIWIWIDIPFIVLVASFFSYLEGANDENRKMRADAE